MKLIVTVDHKSSEISGYITSVYHCVYRDVDRREFTQYTIKFSDGSGCYFRKPKMEICNETL